MSVLCVLWVMAVCHFGVTDAHKILLLPVSVISHARQMMMVGESLADRGHEVYAVFSPKFNGLHLFQHGKIKILLHANKLDDLTTVPVERVIKMIQDMAVKRNLVSSYRENLPEWTNLCVNQLHDDEHFNRLKAMNFDLAIVDIFPFSRCLLILPYTLGIPYVGIETQYEPWLMRTPALPSFVPSNNYHEAYTPDMTFWQRLNNLWMNIDWFAFPAVIHFEDDFVKTYIRDKPFITIENMFGRCLLFLTDMDPVMDYPRPQMPNEIAVGGMTTKPAKPLEGDLLDLVNSATDGVIVMSFGSYTFDFEPELLDKFFSAFKRVKQLIVWKYQKEPEGLPANVKILPWLPQNDLLGHPNTKIFVTHCGNNGQFEALYHGIPMIGYPMFGDQFYNCKRLSYLSYGKCLDSLNFKSDDMFEAINDILTNTSYKDSIELASRVFRDSPMTPTQRAGYWVEHVMKYGGKHLRSHALDMPWYEYMMLDILAFLLAVVITFLFCLYLLVRYIIRRLTKHHHKTD